MCCRCITMKVHTVFSLLIVDSPGFQLQHNHNQCVAFHNLYVNYLSERLYELFQHRTIIAPREQYLQVGHSIIKTLFLRVIVSGLGTDASHNTGKCGLIVKCIPSMKLTNTLAANFVLWENYQSLDFFLLW